MAKNIEENAMSNAMASNAAGTVDLRDWLKDVKQLEQLEQISGAHWDLEIGSVQIGRASCRERV